MTEPFFDSDGKDDISLYHLLRRNDPIAPPSQTFLSALERDIFAKIDNTTHVDVPSDYRMPMWIIQQSWPARAAVFASLLIVTAGFIFGQISGAGMGAVAGANTSSLLALADDPLISFIPSTDASQGDTNDDAE